MPERLGEALLDLDTNDRRYRSNIRRAERDAEGLGRTLDNTAERAAVLGRALALGGAVLGGSALVTFASEWTDLRSRVNNAVGSMRAGEDAMNRIMTMARRSYSSITQTTNAFLQNSTALTELNYNTGQQLDLTETLNNAMVISATRGQQAESVMRAWSNALALGKLDGDNLNTIIQGSARLTKALADSLGVTTTELRKMGAEGRITIREMMGITNQLGQLRAEADAMPATMADAGPLLQNAAMALVGAVDEATGASGFLAQGMIDLADSIDESARRWREGDVPILHFIQRVSELAIELGLLSREMEGSGEEISVFDQRATEAQQAVVDFAENLAGLHYVKQIAPNLPGEIQEIVGELVEGEKSADETRQALVDLGTANPDFSLVLGQLAGLVEAFGVVSAAARDAHATIANQGGAGPMGDGAGRAGAGQAARARKAGEEKTQAYVAEQDRQVSLSREQLGLEQSIAKEKERATAAGVKLSDIEAERIAKLRIAQASAGRGGGGGGGKRAGKSDAEAEAEREKQAVVDLIRSLELERDVLRESDPVQRRMIELRETLAAATPNQRKEIEELISTMEREQAQLDRNQQAAEFFGQTMFDAVTALSLEGASATEVLDQIAASLANAILQATLLGEGPLAELFGMQGVDGKMGGLLGQLFSGFKARGGNIRPGTFGIVGENGPEPVIGTSRGAMVLPNSTISGGSGGGGGAGAITFINQGTPQRLVDQREEDDGSGGRRMVYVLEDMQAAGMTRTGSAPQKALRAMGVAPRVTRT